MRLLRESRILCPHLAVYSGFLLLRCLEGQVGAARSYSIQGAIVSVACPVTPDITTEIVVVPALIARAIRWSRAAVGSSCTTSGREDIQVMSDGVAKKSPFAADACAITLRVSPTLIGPRAASRPANRTATLEIGGGGPKIGPSMHATHNSTSMLTTHERVGAMSGMKRRRERIDIEPGTEVSATERMRARQLNATLATTAGPYVT